MYGRVLAVYGFGEELAAQYALAGRDFGKVGAAVALAQADGVFGAQGGFAAGRAGAHAFVARRGDVQAAVEVVFGR